MNDTFLKVACALITVCMLIQFLCLLELLRMTIARKSKLLAAEAERDLERRSVHIATQEQIDRARAETLPAPPEEK